jgi:hypothetical protein
MKGLSISPSCIGDTYDCFKLVGLLILLFLSCLGSGFTACTSTTTLLSLDRDLFHIVIGLFGFSTKWSMMVRVGPTKVFPSLHTFLCTTKISFCSFCVNHNAQFTSPSSTTWIKTTSASRVYLFPYLRVRVSIRASSLMTFNGPLAL